MERVKLLLRWFNTLQWFSTAGVSGNTFASLLWSRDTNLFHNSQIYSTKIKTQALFLSCPVNEYWNSWIELCFLQNRCPKFLHFFPKSQWRPTSWETLTYLIMSVGYGSRNVIDTVIALCQKTTDLKTLSSHMYCIQKFREGQINSPVQGYGAFLKFHQNLTIAIFFFLLVNRTTAAAWPSCKSVAA